EIKAPVDAPPVAEIAQNTATEVPAEQAVPQAPAVLQTEAVSAPSHEPVVFAEYTPDAEVLAQVPDTATAAEPPAQDIPAQSPEIAAPAAPVAQAPQAAAAGIPAETDSSSDRAYERRALPIEESAVLGNNWRDAVIAKAVGAEPPSSDPVEDVTTNVVVEPTDVNTPKRILLAEDNAINALLTRTLLEAEGHVVETVQDGQLAVEAMKTASYDLIFMDMRMPNMDGLEATRKIRTLPNVSKDLPIIALTANAFDDDRNACFDSGMNDFMTKPVSAEELSEMVIQWTSPREQRMAS
ncbi:MAG: response regulator, partial [Litorimonas sp.]